MHDPFHRGERAIQERTGERDTALRNGRLISDRIPAAAASFVVQQHYCALGWASPGGELWASLLAGPPGFARTDQNRQTLYLRPGDDAGTPARMSPMAAMREGDHLSVLLIDFATRRRLRVNGRVERCEEVEIVLAIDQAYPQCPKYIRSSQHGGRVSDPPALVIREGETLSDDLIEWIRGADTFFVASAHPDGPADVSYRGGRLGFVKFKDGVLRIPDYAGNSMFSTLGNFALNPRAGLVFVDFESNRRLQMTGDVRLDLVAGEPDGEIGCTGRWWEFTPRKWVVSPLNKVTRRG